MLSAELAELRALITPASAGDSDHREARRRLRRSYRSVSAALDSALALGGWPGGRPPSEHEITEALADVLDHACHQDVTTAAAMQRVVLARCPAPVRHYYRNRPLQVRRPRSGSLPAPDLVLDGRMYQPAAPLPNVFLVEVKDQAKWEVPYAAALYGQPADGEYDLAALWGLGHDDPSGLRVPHTWRSDCEGFWHHQVGRNAYVASAVQLDVYVAYASRVLRDLGMADFPDEPRVQGVLVDMWARTPGRGGRDMAAVGDHIVRRPACGSILGKHRRQSDRGRRRSS